MAVGEQAVPGAVNASATASDPPNDTVMDVDEVEADDDDDDDAAAAAAVGSTSVTANCDADDGGNDGACG